ncbi:hypothetical protein HPB52_012022 [Rhipicephalus sanguineus]|uniref:Uncharacterized protein n=1 Tax=Rhipicephalus sanguineus TaxID=34632 RepID=A0A9D4QEJ3_RHISA|nr:hypothetical protein HPB52_012022 [Rhipicephalus sanguineus]
MASTSTKCADVSVLTPDYMALLQSLCAMSKPSVNDVTAIFNEFRRSLDTKKPKSSSRPSKSLSASSRASKQCSGKSGTLILITRRCVVYIYFDITTYMEKLVVWHALKTGAVGVNRLECKLWLLDIPGSMIETERSGFSDALATMKNLTWLTLTNILFNYDVASKIGGYVEETTALTILQFDQVVADDTNAGVFLDHLARNRSVKKLCVNEHLVVARHGQALADAVRNHVTLQEIETEPPPKFELPPPTSRLQTLTFMNCTLVRLQLFNCGLGDEFAMSAAAHLRRDRRLRELSSDGNSFTTEALHHIIGALEVNKTLKLLEVTITEEHPQEGVFILFDLICTINAFSRLYINWTNPRASYFFDSILAAVTPSVSLNLDGREAPDVAECLTVIARNRHLHTVSLECETPAEQAVVQALADTFATTKSLKKVPLISFPGRSSLRRACS